MDRSPECSMFRVAQRGLGCVHDDLGVHGSHAFEELCGTSDYPDELSGAPTKLTPLWMPSKSGGR